MTVRWPEATPEFAFAAACCRGPAHPSEALGASAAAVRDWERAIDLAARHRIVGFVADAVRRAGVALPEAATVRLGRLARANTEANLRNAAEEVRVTSALAAAGAAPLVLKGTLLGRRLYGALTIKTAWDIDILVAPSSHRAAAATLRTLGYRAQVPAADAEGERFDRYAAAFKELVWHNSERGTYLELHRRLVDYPGLLAGLDPARRQRLAGPGGVAIETLADAELFAYLAVHGALHGWARLKWLADLGALAATGDAEALVGAAEAMGAGPAPASALLLAERVLGLALTPALAATLRQRPGVVRLQRVAMASLDPAGERPLAVPTGMADYARLYASHLALADGAGARLRMLAAMLAIPRAPFQARLPAPARAAATVALLPVRALRRLARPRGDEAP